MHALAALAKPVVAQLAAYNMLQQRATAIRAIIHISQRPAFHPETISLCLGKSIAAMLADADLVIVNGGLGPAIDDLTAAILAAIAGAPLKEYPDTVKHLNRWCEKRNLVLNAANMKQAMLPAGASIVDNPVGSAVGFEMTLGSCRVICTPGVPSELNRMLDG
jgi:molybdopterin-biosynthesis enzyme MoeA-like protein